MATEKTTKTATKTVVKAPAKKVVGKEVKVAPKAKSEEIAVIETGGKQYIVAVGDVLSVELLSELELKEGDTVNFDKVVMVDNGKDTTLGTPYIKGAKVTGTYMGERKGPKITIIRYKAKSNRDRKVGHRQHYASIKIESLT